MSNNSQDEAIVFHYLTKWKTEERLSDWTIYSDVVNQFRELGLENTYPEIELSFFGEETEVSKRQKQNSQKIQRLINHEHPDYSNSIESRYKASIVVKAAIAALPLNYRLSCLTEMYSCMGVVVSQKTDRESGADHAKIVQTNMKEGSEAQLEQVKYLNNKTPAQAQKTHKELQESLSATISSISILESENPSLRVGKAAGVK